MGYGYTTAKRDTNEREIITALEAVGCKVTQMDENAGFDLLVVSPRTGLHIVEVKNPSYAWKLTPAEQKTRDDYEAAGIDYCIVETVEGALELIEGVDFWQAVNG